ncbi:hypothetical protein LTR16_004325, partial [Cryomyces antarcticus]
MRVLDLEDLGSFLDDDKFRGVIAKNFFSGELPKFHMVAQAPSNPGGRPRGGRLNIRAIIDAFGEVITEHAPMLEQITEPQMGNILTSALLRWTPRLKHLRSLTLWEGKALADERVRSLLQTHCIHLEAISIYQWQGDTSDHELASFINGLKPQTLKSFEIISTNDIGMESCLALNTHGESLRELMMFLNNDALPALGLLRGCTAIEVLQLVDMHGTTDLEKTQNELFLELIAWLCECKSLRTLALTNFMSAPAIATPVLVEDGIHLRSLTIGARETTTYLAKDNRDFHQALVHQRDLRALLLKGDSSDMTGDDVNVLLDCLCQLTHLRDLKLRGVSDYFSNAHIIALAQHLRELEELYIGGYGVNDDIWE